MEITEGTWVDLGQIMGMKSSYSVERTGPRKNKVEFFTPFSPCEARVEFLSDEEWALLKEVWVGHTSFMNDQEYKGIQRHLAQEAQMERQAEALQNLPAFNVEEATGDKTGPVVEPMVMSNVNEDGETSISLAFPGEEVMTNASGPRIEDANAGSTMEGFPTDGE